MKRIQAEPRKRKTRIWTCKYCKKSFKSNELLQGHYKNNLWEANIKTLKDGRLECLICKRKFTNRHLFMEHWDDDHDDQAVRDNFLSFTSRGKKVYKWRIRPSELELIKQRIRKDRNKLALKDGFVVNEMVLNEFGYGLDDVAMTVIEILGIPGVGKSVLGLTLARQLQLLWTKQLLLWWQTDKELFRARTRQNDFYLPKIRIGFNMDQTAKHIRDARTGDVVMQDEDPALAGINARSIQDQIENLLKIMRESCINLIFISPVLVNYISTPTFVLEVIGKDIDNRLTIAACYDRQHNAHGWTIHEILPEIDPLMVNYKKMKRDNIERIKAMSGKEGARFDKDDLMRDANILYEFIKTGGFVDIEHTSVTREFLKTMCMFVDEIKGSNKYIDAVAMTLKQILDTKKSFSELTKTPGMVVAETKTFITSDDEFVIELEEVIEDNEFLEKMFEYLSEALAHKERCGDKSKKLHIEWIKDEKGNLIPRSKHAEAWYLIYARGYPLQQAAEALAHYKADAELTSSALANSYEQGGWRAIYQVELSGYAAEVTFKKLYCPDEDGWELVAGHGDIDIRNNEDDTWIELKIRNRLKPKEKPEEQITPMEYQHVREGKPFKLVRVGYVPNKPARIEIWNITINPEWLKSAVDVQLAATEAVEDGDEEEVEEVE